MVGGETFNNAYKEIMTMTKKDNTQKLKDAMDIIKQIAKDTTGLDVEDKHNPPGAQIDVWDNLEKKQNRGGTVTPLNCRYNTATILRQDNRYDSLCYNEHSDQILWMGQMVGDAEMERIAYQFEQNYRYKVTEKALRASIIMVSQERTIEPIKDWLNDISGQWDGVPRCESFFKDILNAQVPPGCEDLIDEMSKKWFISCVARILEPGCKMDNCLVLVGGKGKRKSTALKYLASEKWFSDSNINISHKDAYELLHQSGVWIWELAEMHALQGKTADNAKQFLTSASDRYRPSYAKLPVQRNRRTVFTASTNNYQFLSDGPERRFWIIEIMEKIDTEWILEHRTQLWAEAVQLYATADWPMWWLSEEKEAQMIEYQQTFIIDDPWTFKVREALASGKKTTQELMEHLDLPVSQQHIGNSKRIGQICKEMGYEQSYNKKMKTRIWKVKK